MAGSLDGEELGVREGLHGPLGVADGCDGIGVAVDDQDR
jgi:hypothetical protein